MTDADQLHQDIARYLACVDIARTDPLDLAMGLGAPAMLESYPRLEGVQAYRRRNGGALGLARQYADAARLGPNVSPS